MFIKISANEIKQKKTVLQDESHSERAVFLLTNITNINNNNLKKKTPREEK